MLKYFGISPQTSFKNCMVIDIKKKKLLEEFYPKYMTACRENLQLANNLALRLSLSQLADSTWTRNSLS